MPPPTPVTLDFTMKREGESLHIDYTITNRTKASFLVRDVMVIPAAEPADLKLVAAPDALITVGGMRETEVRFVRGDIAPDSKVTTRYPAALRVLDGAGTLKGSAVVALPLTAWHPYGKVDALEAVPTTAVLEIQIFPNTIAQIDATLADGTVIKLASPTSVPPQTLQAGPKPIP